MEVTENPIPSQQPLNRKTAFLKLSVFCALAIFMNFLVSNFFINILGIPLFIDTVFTAAITFTFGLIPGIIVAVLSWLIPSIINMNIHFFILCGLTEVILIYALKPRNVNIPIFASKEKIITSYTVIAAKLMILYITCTVTISILGGIINFFPQFFLRTHENYFSIEDTFKHVLIVNNLPALAVNILSRIPINIVDRFIVIFGGYFISRGLIKFILKS